MFILNGNRRPKVIFYNEINYSDNPSALPMFGWKKYNNYVVPPTSDNFTGYFSAVANKIKNLKSSVKIDDKFKTMEDILPEDKVESLLLLREKYDAEIFVFTCYEKKNKKLKVAFYIVPKLAISKVRSKEGLFGNKDVFLKTNYIFPSELVKSPYKKEYIEKKTNFSDYKKMSFTVTRNRSGEKTCIEKNIMIKEDDDFIETNKTIYFKKEDFSVSGKFKVLLDGVEYICVVDMEKFGTKDNPFYFLYNPFNIKNI